MWLTITSLERAMKEPMMLDACLKKVINHGGDRCEIIPMEREEKGWLEWCLKFNNFILVAIQRKAGEEIEFVS